MADPWLVNRYLVIKWVIFDPYLLVKIPKLSLKNHSIKPYKILTVFIAPDMIIILFDHSLDDET